VTHAIDHRALRGAIARALAPFALEPRHVGYVADTLVETSLDGIDTHGVRLLETYVAELAGGRAKPRPDMRVLGAMPALALLDADDALGVVAGNVAIELAMERARELGIAAVSVRNSNHFGAAGHYTQRAARAGLIALAFSNSDALVAPFGGTVAMNGTNPIAMAAPGVGDDTFALDMATSQVSYSKFKQYLAAERPLERGWAQDAEGADASESGAVETLQALGGYKGQGLGMLVQILAALLAGMPDDRTISHLYAPPYDAPRKIGHFFVCIDPRATGDADAFRARVSALNDAFRSSRASGADPVLVPGDKERAARAARLAHGIPLSADEWRFFRPYVTTHEQTLPLEA
jgi:LDH2 family malate/lactate/ureidoglycolate dehydrogenase